MSVAIEPWLVRPRTARDQADLNRVFFTSSATQQFGSVAERMAFRERWLGRYLTADATHAFVAVDRAERLVGYVVGSVEDIASLARFADLSSARAFAAVSARFPAHLHINVAADLRGAGVGARLIEAFVSHAQAWGASGVHVLTSAASRNVGFYRRCGFHEASRIAAAGNATVFLARAFRGTPADAIKT